MNEHTLFLKELKISTIRDAVVNIANELLSLTKSDSEIKPSSLLGVERKLLTMFSEDGLWEDFKAQFENIRPNFFQKLKEKFPELSVNDLKHCSYIVSNLKNKEVAHLIKVSPRSVETARYRIKQKMNLGKEEKLFDFLQTI